MTTDTSEKGLERLICTSLTGAPCDPPRPGGLHEALVAYGGSGWICGAPEDYDRVLPGSERALEEVVEHCCGDRGVGQPFAGHADLGTTERYVEPSLEAQRRLIALT